MKTKVTKRQAETQINRFADKVSADDVVSTVKNRSRIMMLFRCVDRLVEFRDDVTLIFMMLKDYTAGRYRKCPWRTIAVLVGAIGYVLTPLDLVPDFIQPFGWADDGLVLSLAIAFAKLDLEAYRSWKSE